MFHWDVDPEILSLGPVRIRYYGVLFVGAFYAGCYVACWIYRREVRRLADLDGLLLTMMVGAVVGGRIGHCLLYTAAGIPTKPTRLDRMAIPAALGGSLIRVGNFVNSEIIGRPSGQPWGVVFVPLSVGQLLSLPAIGAGLLLLLWAGIRQRRRPSG